MSFNALMTQTPNLTRARQESAMGMFDLLAREVATNLVEGRTTREIAIVALSQIVAGYVPQSGKGHADRVKEQVTDTVDGYITELNNAKGKKG